MKPSAIMFDAYGTLFDVHSVILRAGAGMAGNLQVLSNLWRRKQLERTWLLALMERYEDFERVTESALRSAIRQLGLEAGETQIEGLLEAYFSPDAFPEAGPALEALRGIPLAILSNGTSRMIEAAVRHNGLTGCFKHIISVETAGTYKPSPRVYSLGPETMKVPAAETLFMSSNGWDAAGAKAYGYRVCWCNRSGAEWDEMGFAPDFHVTGLGQIPGSFGQIPEG
jgi:2-haloacid dehalogenase